MAHTGVAASLIDGVTLHTYFNVRFSANSSIFKIEPKSQKWHAIESVDLFIIDEYSTLDVRIFQEINEFLQVMHQNFVEDFGGKSVILMGDPGQLPVIENSSYQSSLYKYCLAWQYVESDGKQYRF